jgi:hypothetical protein
MAKLLKGLPPEFVERNLYPFGDSRYAYRKDDHGLEQEAMRLIEARTTVLRQQVADSYAYYEVVERQPLKVRWIPYMDAWEADPAWIRGLRLSDVLEQERWESYMDSVRNKFNLGGS